MIGSFLTRALALILGYAYPAYECFKTVELNRPEIDQLRFWCQYWILVAALTVFERVGESFISWLPMYSEAKVAFLVYLWYPKTRGTAYVYETFFRPYVAKHETEIDRNLIELRTRAGDMVVLYSQRIVSYGQTRFFEILQYVASQSPSQSSRPRPAQQRQPQQAQPQQSRQAVPATTTRQTPVLQPPPPSPTKGKAQLKEQTKAVVAPVIVSSQSQSSANTVTTASTSLPTSSETTASSSSSASPYGGAEAMQVDEVGNATAASNKNSNPPPLLPPQETPMEEVIRVTRGRLRKRAATSGA